METFIYKNRFNIGSRKNTQLNRKHQTKYWGNIVNKGIWSHINSKLASKESQDCQTTIQVRGSYLKKKILNFLKSLRVRLKEGVSRLSSGFQTLNQGFKVWKGRVLEKLREGKKSEEKT